VNINNKRNCNNGCSKPVRQQLNINQNKETVPLIISGKTDAPVDTFQNASTVCTQIEFIALTTVQDLCDNEQIVIMRKKLCRSSFRERRMHPSISFRRRRRHEHITKLVAITTVQDLCDNNQRII